MSASRIIDALNKTIEQLHKTITACEHSTFKARILLKIDEVVDEIKEVAKRTHEPLEDTEEDEESRKLDL